MSDRPSLRTRRVGGVTRPLLTIVAYKIVDYKIVAYKTVARNFPRFPFDSRLTITTYRSGAKCCCWGRAANISESGLAATVSDRLAVGDTVTIQFPLGDETVEVRAAVRFHNGLFCGFEFLVLDDKTRATIRRICEQLHSSQSMRKTPI